MAKEGYHFRGNCSDGQVCSMQQTHVQLRNLILASSACLLSGGSESWPLPEGPALLRHHWSRGGWLHAGLKWTCEPMKGGGGDNREHSGPIGALKPLTCNVSLFALGNQRSVVR